MRQLKILKTPILEFFCCNLTNHTILGILFSSLRLFGHRGVYKGLCDCPFMEGLMATNLLVPAPVDTEVRHFVNMLLWGGLKLGDINTKIPALYMQVEAGVRNAHLELGRTMVALGRFPRGTIAEVWDKFYALVMTSFTQGADGSKKKFNKKSFVSALEAVKTGKARVSRAPFHAVTEEESMTAPTRDLPDGAVFAAG